MKSIACSCGGQNPKCVRCGGLGYFDPDGLKDSLPQPRLRHGHHGDSAHRKFNGRGTPPRPDPAVDARAQELVQAANSRVAQENARRSELARQASEAQAAKGIRGPVPVSHRRGYHWDSMSETQKQQWRQLAIDEISQASRKAALKRSAASPPSETAPSSEPSVAAIKPLTVEPVEPPNPGDPAGAGKPGAPQPSAEETRAFRCPECLQRFRELFPLDAHLFSEHGRRAHAHYWEDAYRRHHGIEPRPEISNRTNTGEHKPPAARLPAQPGDAIFNRVLSHFSAATPVLHGGEFPRKADGGRDGSYGGGGSFRDFAKSSEGSEFGSYPQFDPMDDESGA